MAGHSKWAGIKHKKAIVDAKRGKLFSKLAKELTVAAKLGGGDTDTNPRLRLAVQKAREGNMPKDNVEKAIKKGTGEIPGVTYEEVIMEAYGPGGVAILIEGLTDNKNRTAAELRSLLNKNNGNSAGAGSVAYLFEQKGLIQVSLETVGEDKVMEVALEAGAEDFQVENKVASITSEPGQFESIKQSLEAQQIPMESAEVTLIPSTLVRVEDAVQVKQLLNLLELLEDHDDSQNVYANFDIPDELMPSDD